MSIAAPTSLAALALACACALATGAGFLDLPLPGGLPVGNALAAVALAAFAAVPVLLGKPGSALRSAARAVLAAALAWLPVSAALAGNLALNFGNGRGETWLALSAMVAVAVLVTLTWALGDQLVDRCRRGTTPP